MWLYDSDGKTLVSASYDTIVLWEVGTEKFTEIETPVNLQCVAIHPYGSLLASGQTEGVFLWHAMTGEEIARLEGHVHKVTCLAFSPDGKILASGGGTTDHKVILWNITTTEVITTLTGHTEAVRCVAFSPDGNTLVSGSWDGTALVWNIADFQK